LRGFFINKVFRERCFMKFTEMGLCESILRAIKEKGYDTPTPIQAQSIEAVMKGGDVMAAAQTGTGKTAAFVLPILERFKEKKIPTPLYIRVLILTPTRELAAQIEENIKLYGKYLDLTSGVVFGGVNIQPQMRQLRRGVDILVATPGRLLDLFSQGAVKFGKVEVLVLDEADRMLDMGFIHDIKKIKALLPHGRQNLMYSATFSPEIRNLAKGMINDPVEISVTPRNTAVESVTQIVLPVDKTDKTAMLTLLIHENQWKQVLVFTRTKHGANRLAKKLESKHINAAAIHGNKSQGARTKALADFKSGKIRVLVATDIAARGLDIDHLPHVVNFELPNIPEDYVHRIGRTGRAGRAGDAVSLVSFEEFKELSDIEHLIKQIIPRQNVGGFTQTRALPKSSLTKRAPKVKNSSPSRGGRPSRKFQGEGSSSGGKEGARNFAKKRGGSGGFKRRGSPKKSTIAKKG
jgi:ATP-dependent RNA helicase RhlE